MSWEGVGGRVRSMVLGGMVFALLLFGAVSASGSSNHGALDPTFTGFHGRFAKSVGPGSDVLRGVAFMPDGTIVAAGSSANGSNDDIALVRVLPGGSLDPTFGSGGIVTTPIGSGDDRAEALVVQKDKKIVVAGTSFNGSDEDFALVRYDPNGSLDPTFGTGGKVVTPIGSGDDRADALVVQSDGKLVAAGHSEGFGSNDDFALVRYNVNGSLDTSFATGGKVTTPIGSGSDQAYSLGLQKDGGIVAAGLSSNGSNDDFAVARYLPSGSPDPNFGTGGNVTTSIGSGDDQVRGLAIQKDAKIVVAGSSSNGSNNDFALARYNPNGSLDTSFGGGGEVTTPIGTSHDDAYAIVLQSDGKLVVAGDSAGSPYDFALARYTKNGSLDSAFGTGGTITTSIGSDDDHADALALQEKKGRVTALVAAGSTSGSSNEDFALARYKANGALDSTFTSRPGRLTMPIGFGDDRVNAVALQKNSKFAAAGSTSNGANDDFVVASYLSDGSPDTTFGTAGVVTTSIGSGDDRAYAMVVQPDGKLVAAGSTSNGSNDDIAVARYNVNGSPDTSFGTGGQVTTPIGSDTDEAYALLIQKDGKLVVAGSSRNGSHDDFALVRYNVNGSLDLTFGTGGKVTTPVGSGGVARALRAQPDGRLIAAGSASNGSNDDFALVRYNVDGSLDGTFGTGGKVTTPFGAQDDQAFGLVLQKTGRPIAAGSTFNGTDNDFALARYTTDGLLDTTFGGDGRVTTSIGAGDDNAYALVLQKNQKPIAVGSTWNGTDTDFALTRYETNGAPNLAFGTAGITTVSVGSGDDVIRAAVEQVTDLIVGGTTFNGSNYDFGLARYILCANPNGC